MPLTSRRPQFLTISITAPDSANSSDGMRTPAPVTPLAYAPETGQAPMVMTPDTPGFTASALGALATQIVAGEPDRKHSPWTEEEDAILQTALSRPVSRAYPPGSLPPSQHIDRLTTEIINRFAAPERRLKRGRSASMSSYRLGSSLQPDLVATPTGETALDKLEVEYHTPVETPLYLTTARAPAQDDSRLSSNADAGWPHTWDDTRSRLFEIARLESRAAVGGHRRNQSESFVPIPADKVNLPFISFGPTASRQTGGSFTGGAYGEAPPTITEAVRLSSHLQGCAMDSDSELHFGKGLFSPVKIEFGGQVDFGASNNYPLAGPNPIIRKSAAPPMPAVRPAINGRPSLLQRGVSYTTADLAHMSHSRNASSSSDITMTDVSLGSPGSTEPSPTSEAERNATVDNDDDDEVDSFGRSVESVMFSFSFPRREAVIPPPRSQGTNVDEAEQDPFTPLHQIAFPAAVLGLGPRRIGQSPDLTPDSNKSKPPSITLSGSGENSPLQSAYPSSQTTPRLSENILGSTQPDVAATIDPVDPTAALERLAISSDIPPNADLELPLSGLSDTAVSSINSWRPPKLTRSRSELSPLSGHLARIPPSMSIPTKLASHASPSPPPTAAAVVDSHAGHRESKRQRAFPAASTGGSGGRSNVFGSATQLPSAGSGISGSGRRLNPGLTVRVPTNAGMSGEALRSPFEHKIPNTNGMSLDRE